MIEQSQANNFDNPISAAIYDTAEGTRDDLLAYVAIAQELGAHSVIDIGCGTGAFALLLAERGYSVTGVDPAAAMLDIARAKPGADQVRWVHGTAEALSATADTTRDATRTRTGEPEPARADLAVMTGNVAQVFLTDDEWLSTLRAIHAALRPDGHLVFETRIPERRAWEEWAHWGSSVYHVDGVGEVRDLFKVLSVDEPFVTFSSDNTLPDGSILPNRCTLIFRSMTEIERTLGAAGFTIQEVRDAPDRPGREWVIISQRDPT